MRKDHQIFEIDYRIISLINREAEPMGFMNVMIERNETTYHASIKEKFRLMIGLFRA